MVQTCASSTVFVFSNSAAGDMGCVLLLFISSSNAEVTMLSAISHQYQNYVACLSGNHSLLLSWLPSNSTAEVLTFVFGFPLSTCLLPIPRWFHRTQPSGRCNKRTSQTSRNRIVRAISIQKLKGLNPWCRSLALQADKNLRLTLDKSLLH